MTTDKTLADVQPGGRVRLGDQAERARFEAWPQAREFEIQKDGSGEYLSEVTHGAWLAWKYLSAQPSPGGQEDAGRCGKCKGRGYVHVDVDVDDSGGSIGNIEACPHCAIAAPPSPGGQGDARRQWLEVRGLAAGIVKNLQAFADSPHKGAWCGALDDALSFADQIEKDAAAAYESILAASQPVRHVRLPQSDLDLINDAAARQPVGEPVAYGVSNRDGLWMCHFGLATINKESAESFAAWAEEHRTISGPFTVVSLYAAPPAQAVDLGKLLALADRWATDRSYSGSPADDLRAWIDSQAVGK